MKRLFATDRFKYVNIFTFSYFFRLLLLISLVTLRFYLFFKLKDSLHHHNGMWERNCKFSKRSIKTKVIKDIRESLESIEKKRARLFPDISELKQVPFTTGLTPIQLPFVFIPLKSE